MTKQAIALTILAVLMGMAMELQAVNPGGRRLGTIGPPPRANPQRQTAAEGMPPLPLPVVPLRRSEPKAEPTAPLFLGKLIYGDSQDYMPNPGDTDNLMRQVRYQLGLWYGQRLINLDEIVAGYKAGKPSKIPLLYITGYQKFELTDEQRAALRDYLLNGGTLLGDATLGSPAFAESFVAEARKMFPDHPFDLLQTDHPVFRGFYQYSNVHYYEIEKGYRNTYEGPPVMMGMNLGTRTAVILSPFDMSCGWDEFYAPASTERAADAPRSRAMIPGDAIRMGVNLVSYVAALRQVGEVEAVTRVIQAPADRPRQQFVFAQLRHQGDWNPDTNSIYQLLRHLALESSLAVGFELKYVDPVESQIAPYPFLFMTGFRDPKLTDPQIEALRRHLEAGGFLFINNCSGYAEFDQHVRALVQRLFPDQPMQAVPANHPLLNSFYKIEQVRDRNSGQPRPLELEGITIKDRLVLVYSKNDAITQLRQISDPYGNGYDAEGCRQIAVNIVAYALQN